MTAKVGLRAAAADDYAFALAIYVETIKPYTVAYMEWIDAEQTARFARLWMPAEVRIITADGMDAGWMQASESGPQVVLKQMYLAPRYQRQGIGSQILRLRLDEWAATNKAVVLGVLKNNPARRLYERLGFAVTSETDTKFMMRREARPSSRL